MRFPRQSELLAYCLFQSTGHTEGRVPLQTLRADIDYAWVNAFTTYGEIGVQVWINRGEVLPTRKNKPASKPAKGGNR